jgi:DNA polymerase (family 10)
MKAEEITNEQAADVLERIADLLEMQDANPHRVRAYREGAETLRHAQKSVAEMVREGDQEKLQQLPGIGKGLSRVIEEYVETGRSSQIEQLQAEIDPQALFDKVPGIGKELSERIVEELGIHSLEELETAAHDGSLEEVEGFGPQRARAVRIALSGMLSQSARRRARRVMEGNEAEGSESDPSVGTLLEVDRQYRQKAQAGELRVIAPRRFNPQGKAWLPIMRTKQEGWSFTALFSNTARAHELGATHDWVVIYYERDGREDQCTVVTETHGPLEGKRVVRGREGECREYYRSQGG